MAYILLIDTSTDRAVVMLSRDGAVLQSISTDDSRNHAATLNLLIEDILKRAEISLGNLDAVAVMGGPGSYTGLRIGLSTAKALCYVLERPLMMTNKLDLLTLQKMQLTDRAYDHYLTLIPAREKEYFACLYDKDGTVVNPASHMPEDKITAISKQLTGQTMVTGVSEEAALNFEFKTAPQFDEIVDIDSDFYCQNVQKRFDCNDFVILAAAEPFYLKQVYVHKKL